MEPPAKMYKLHKVSCLIFIVINKEEHTDD